MISPVATTFKYITFRVKRTYYSSVLSGIISVIHITFVYACVSYHYAVSLYCINSEQILSSPGTL
jgi:hypothetical protein